LENTLLVPAVFKFPNCITLQKMPVAIMVNLYLLWNLACKVVASLLEVLLILKYSRVTQINSRLFNTFINVAFLKKSLKLAKPNLYENIEKM